MNKTLLAVGLAILNSSSCVGDKSPTRSASPESPAAPLPPAEMKAVQPLGYTGQGSPSSGRAQEQTLSQPVPQKPVGPSERKVIRNGTVSLEVKSVDTSLAAIKSLVRAAGGYTGNESAAQDAYAARTASLTCRVPASKLDELLSQIKALGKLETVSLTAEDVTEQYFNLEIRIENQKRLEARLMDLIRRPTNKLSDLLEIEREVARVRGGIDEMEGRRRFWDSQVALSTLVVQLHEPRPAIAVEEGGFYSVVADSFKRAANNFVLVIAGLISFTGGFLPFAAIGLGAFWLWRRRKRPARPAQPDA